MKKSFILFSMILFLFMFTSPTLANEAIINTDNVNVRNGPGIHFKKINQVQIDEVYPIIQTHNKWVEIQLGEGSGWITTEYITMKEAKNEVKSINKSIFISVDNTHIRNGPSTEDDIIDFVSKGAELDVVSEDDSWYKVIHGDHHGYIFKQLINKKGSTSTNNLIGKTIVIDAGHGGHDVGAIGVSGTYEKDIVAKTTTELKEKLTILGAEVILTRINDEYIGLPARASLSNHTNADAFISIHYNSLPEKPDVSGVGTYYYRDENMMLANAIQTELINLTEAKDRDIAFEDFQVLRQNYQPAVLVELGFISHYKKEQLLLTNEYQNKLVRGIITGLNNFFTKEQFFQ